MTINHVSLSVRPWHAGSSPAGRWGRGWACPPKALPTAPLSRICLSLPAGRTSRSPPPHTHTQLTGSTPSVGSVGDRRSVATICKSLRVAQLHRDAATAQRIASQLPCSPLMQLPEGRQSAPHQRSPAACPCSVVASGQHLSSASCSCVGRFGGNCCRRRFHGRLTTLVIMLLGVDGRNAVVSAGPLPQEPQAQLHQRLPRP